jgi:hypothetical protein
MGGGVIEDRDLERLEEVHGDVLCVVTGVVYVRLYDLNYSRFEGKVIALITIEWSKKWLFNLVDKATLTMLG